MLIDEIFSKIATHMYNGVRFHEQLINCYSFLCFKGYEKCQEYHYYSEIKNYRNLTDYYLSHFHKLLKEDEKEVPLNVIPPNWYKYQTIEVDNNTKKTAIRDFTKKWIDWEKDTKKMLEESYKTLYESNEIAAALAILPYIEDVTEELKGVEEDYARLETIGYDLSVIVPEQKELYNFYNKKIAKI